MFASFRTASRLTRPAALAALLLCLAPCARAADNGAPPRAAGRYKALIVCVPSCADAALPALKRAPESAKLLAAALLKLKYRVTRLDGGDATAKNVVDWLESNAAPKDSDLVILALIGHGGRRGDDTYFLTVKATQDRGGLELDAIDVRGAKGKWPLVVIVDCCQTKLPAGKPPVRLAGLAGIKRGEGAVFRGPAGKTGHKGRTWLYSTQPGEPAFDKHDLVSALVAGLEIDPKTRRFRADPFFRVPGHRDRGKALSLYDWFFFGVNKVMQDHEMRQMARVRPGIPALRTLLAQPDPPGPPGKPAQGTDEISLLDYWRPQHGDLTAEADAGNQTWRISRPAGAVKAPWIGGYVDEPGEGFDTTGRAVFIELLASWAPFHKGVPIVGIDVKFVDQANGNTHVHKGAYAIPHQPTRVRRVLKARQVMWCKIELEPKKRLNYFAITDVPRGCVITIRRVLLAPAARLVPREAAQAVNVLARWWVGDMGRVEKQGLRCATEVVGGRRVTRVDRGPGWVGGVVGPPIWVAAGDAVEVVVENTAPDKAQVLIELKEYFTVLAGEVIELPPGRSTRRFTVTRAGLVNYFAITKPTADLRFYAVTLKPRPPRVAGAEKAPQP